MLKEHDPLLNETEAGRMAGIQTNYQLLLGVERCRVPELLFQPSLIGSPVAGVPQLIERVLSSYSPEVRDALCSNFFITGGGSLVPGFTVCLEVRRWPPVAGGGRRDSRPRIAAAGTSVALPKRRCFPSL